MSCRGLIAAVATVAAIVSGDAGAGLATPQSRQERDLAAYDLGVAAAVRSDLTASVQLPDGGQVYVFGDTLAVNGQVICGPSHCPYGYPHDSIAIQRPGTATFAMQSCAATACPYGWQWVPNWPDGSYFWMAAPAVEGNSLYVIGERISRSAGAVEGEYTARSSVGADDALTYQGITALTGVGCLHQAQRHHRQHPGAALRLARHRPWHVAAQRWQATPAPGCAWTYSTETHPASPAPRGTMLVSWASNHDDPGTTCDMQSQFTDLPIGSPPPRADGSGCGPPTGGDIRFPLRPRTETIVPGVSSSERKGGAVDVRPDSRAFRQPLTPGGRRHLPRGEMP